MELMKIEDITPVDPKALTLAYALEELIDARANLTRASDNIPSYTGHLSDADYIIEETDAFNRAANAYAEAAKALMEQ